MTDLRTGIQSAIMDHIHEVRGVAALTDAIMGVVEKQSDDVHLWRFWNEKARELASSNDSLRRDNASFIAANTDLVSEVETLRQQLAEERNRALEDAASYVERISHQGLHASMWRNMFKQVSDAIRAMKGKP